MTDESYLMRVELRLVEWYYGVTAQTQVRFLYRLT